MTDLFTGTSFWAVAGSLLLLVAGALAKRYVVPYLKIGRRMLYARYIAMLADELTDDLRARYPKEEWLRHLDEAIDQLIVLCEVSADTAQRAVHAAAARK